MHYDTNLRNHGLKFDPFKALAVPRPIGWIATVDRDGVPNLAPYSFFNAVSDRPPMVMFSSGGHKDSLRNIEATGEFVWNLVTRPLAEAMNQTCAPVGPEVDEFALAGLTPVNSNLVQVPRVLESPVSFECRCAQVVQLQTAAGATVPSWLVLGEVVGVHLDRRLLVDGVYDTAAAGHVLRGGGPADYFSVGPEQLFKMFRPQ